MVSIWIEKKNYDKRIQKQKSLLVLIILFTSEAILDQIIQYRNTSLTRASLTELLGQEGGNMRGYINTDLIQESCVSNWETESFRCFIDLFRLNSLLLEIQKRLKIGLKKCNFCDSSQTWKRLNSSAEANARIRVV